MIYTIGHSTHPQETFTQIAKDMNLIIDVRSHPTSRHPQYRAEALRDWLPACKKSYMWLADLGGWTKRYYPEYHKPMAEVGVDLSVYSEGHFPKQHIARDKEPTGTPTWWNQGLHDFSWFTSTREFLDAAETLIHYGKHKNVAIMCAEALWWKCHRSMIADYLHFRGVFCGHLPTYPPKPTTPPCKAHSDVIGNRLERYPAGVISAWASYAAA